MSKFNNLNIQVILFGFKVQSRESRGGSKLCLICRVKVFINYFI